MALVLSNDLERLDVLSLLILKGLSESLDLLLVAIVLRAHRTLSLLELQFKGLAQLIVFSFSKHKLFLQIRFFHLKGGDLLSVLGLLGRDLRVKGVHLRLVPGFSFVKN